MLKYPSRELYYTSIIDVAMGISPLQPAKTAIKEVPRVQFLGVQDINGGGYTCQTIGAKGPDSEEGTTGGT